MKKLILSVLFIAFIFFGAKAQAPQRRAPQALPPPLALREVSGVVKDTTDNTIIGAVITLTSKKDTIRTATNLDGIFVFKNVKQATFVLTVTSIGYATITRRYLNNDVAKHIVLEPIVLRKSNRMLREVTIDGSPSITYKTDTVEYKASDYKVRPNATVDELIKKMEGMEVGTDGSVTHQGQQITRARLNGKDYAGGDVAQAIQNLPADIVEKIQVVDDYGDQAARTGIKDGDPQKVLNITTRADRSVGTTGRLTGQYGNDDRYNARLFAQRINANQQLGIIANLANTVNGVASTGVAGGATNGGGGGSGVGAGARGTSSPGTTKSGQPSVNYRDQWGKKVQVIGSYSFNFRDNNSLNKSYGFNPSQLGNSVFTDHSTTDNNSKGHNVNLQLEYTIDSANYLQVTPNLNYSSAVTSSTGFSDVINYYNPGFSHRVTNSGVFTPNSNLNYGAIVFYQHIFKKPRRNASIQLSVNRSDAESSNDRNDHFMYYKDTTLNNPHDSLVHYYTNRSSLSTTYRSSVTYVEPITSISQFEFNGQVRKTVYDTKAITDTVLNNAQYIEIPARDNIFNYSFMETRATLNYKLNGLKYRFAVGATLVPTQLDGTKVNSSTGQNVSTTRSDFRVIPVFQFSYSWSRTARFSLIYSGTNTEPSFQQIQPYKDVSNTAHPIVGNPDLRAAFNHSISAQYNNYFANSQFNISVNGNATFNTDQITQNNLIITQRLINGNDTTNNSITETRYVNLSGSHSFVGRYNVSKQLDDRRYNLSLNGNVSYSYSVAMSNNVLYNATNWRFDERFGPHINPNEAIELNPYIGYDLSRTFNSLPKRGNVNNNVSPQVQTTSLAIDGRIYVFKTFNVDFSATKSYVVGLTSFNTNPLVINAGFEKEFFEKRNLVLTFNAFDLLHQNNFVQQNINAQTGGVTNTESNTLSRYFLIGMRLNLQRWSGSPNRNGRKLMRRGDGSFIY